MGNTITLNSESTQNQLDKNTKSPSFNLSWSLRPIVVYVVFLATCLTLAFGGLVAFSIAFFIIGSIGLAALYIWDNATKMEMDLSFKVDLEQSELEKDLYREAI
ncbi:hypothetical protein PXC01_00895 [Maribacter sp. M208]|uniref:hypothetical protein n=1 Tax=Maribacter TaxID=252356 RepID=UPI0023ECC773|nr:MULTISPECIES: hypothetical protein [Maribacter]MDF4220122.1 hypothetical protein [Maribacter huludaoensis]